MNNQPGKGATTLASFDAVILVGGIQDVRKLLGELSCHSSEKVRGMVVDHPYTPGNALRIMAEEDSNLIIRKKASHRISV